MRAFCTVSAPLEVCASSAEQLSPGSRFLALRLLGTPQPRTLYFLVDAKSRVREVYTQTCVHFATQGMLDTELFGLAVLIDGEYMFADPESKLSKYGPKSWRSSHTHGLDANGRPLLELHFRVQFYIENPFILKDETSRHHYYLQLKANAVSRDVPKEYSEQSMILLASLSLQVDLGDAPISGAASSISNPAAAAVEATVSVSHAEDSSEVAKDPVDSSRCSGDCGASSISDIGGRTIDKNLSTVIAGTTTTVTTVITTPPTPVALSSGTTTTTAAAAATAAGTITTTATRTIINKKTCSVRDKIICPKIAGVLPISGSLKHSLGSVVASLSTTSSSSSINRSASLSSSQLDYFRLDEYLPSNLRTAWIANVLRACHRENRGMSAADAKLRYIQQACLLHEGINSHMFRMRMSKNECSPGNSWFVVYAKGIKIYGGGNQQQITFLWPNITKLSFERKKFEIRSGDNKITLYATSDEKNKMLLSLCKETHQFSMKIAARLKEVIKRDEEESNSLHACYIYSRSLHLPYKNKNDQRISVISSTSSNTTSGIVSDRVHSEDELEIMINTPPAPIAAPSTESLALAHLLDRPSVSRQTSSVGQVSLKDLEDQLAALSVRQQRKLSTSNSGGESSSTELLISTTATGGVTLSSNQCANATTTTTTDSSNSTDSPNSQHNIGSQCSSTCSTVVVAAVSDTPTTLTSLAIHHGTGTNVSNRRGSTSSSLELGFSHTAQNSTLSEGESTFIDHDFITSTRDETESVSGVYTLAHGAPPTETSGVYTMHSSEMTGQSSEIAESESQSSSHYGMFQPTKGEIGGDDDDDENNDTNENILQHEPRDSVDGGGFRNRIKTEDFRMRSDSNVSTSGSFRGDGSDPTDMKHTLLSAEELTDLIVGRGTYPCRKTVSRTLDSDCDYVTLPLTMKGDSYIQGHQDTAPTDDHDMMDDILPTDPPAPPERIDSNAHHASLVNLGNIRMRSPPPYNARHEKTGLCGPPIRCSLPKLAPAPVPNIAELREPPPYTQVKPRPTSLVSIASSSSSSLSSAMNQVHVTGSMNSLKPEEVTARFITTRPHINILKAHTSVVSENPKPSYAAPTHCTNVLQPSHHAQQMHSSIITQQHLTQHSSPHHVAAAAAYGVGATQASPVATSHQKLVTGPNAIPSTIGIPIVPYNLHVTHKSMSSLQPTPPPPPYPEMKATTRTCVLLPVIKPRQFLPPPPPSLPRQPPPPPPPQLATVYSSQLARKQIELYQQQLYSDVDYVIYPIQDPAVSQQEYLDSKQGSLLAAMAAQTPPPPHPYLAYHTSAGTHSSAWDTYKSHAIYRSTPYLPMALSHSRYASTQNLSDTYVQLPGAYSPLYSPSMASLCSSYEPPPPPPLHPAAFAAAAAAAAANPATLFARSRSDDNILNSFESLPKVKRLPPPPPPPYVNRRLKKPPMPTPAEKPPPIPSKPPPSLNSTQPPPSYHNSSSSSSTSSRVIISHREQHQPSASSVNRSHMPMTSSGAHWAGETPHRDHLNYVAPLITSGNRTNNNTLFSGSSSSLVAGSSRSSVGHQQPLPSTAAAAAAVNAIDIALLREKSRHLDLPLISALCNDRSLLKQTKAFVMPKHQQKQQNGQQPIQQDSPMVTSVGQQPSTYSSTSKSMSTLIPSSNTFSSSVPSSTNLNKQSIASSTSKMTSRCKTSISHRHPNDKLPPLPMQMAEANNYVIDPTPIVSKHHKNYQPPT